MKTTFHKKIKATIAKEAILTGNYSYIARKYKISPSTVSSWVKEEKYVNLLKRLLKLSLQYKNTINIQNKKICKLKKQKIKIYLDLL